MSAVINVEGLTKEFGAHRAVDNLSFSVQEGEIYGFLGQNGAGKSTTIRMLLTLVRPTAGRIQFMGLDLRTHRNEILRQAGAVIERPDTYNYLSGMENISLFARMGGMQPTRNRLMEKLEMVGLAGRERDKVKTYSQGMKQRLAIAIAMVHDPGVLVLDEPTNGLDPQGIADVRNLILDLGKNHKKTILISSHLLSEVELMADRILIIDKGKKVMEGLVSDLFDPARMILEIQSADGDQAMEIIRKTKWFDCLQKRSGHEFIFQVNRDDIPSIARDLVDYGVPIFRIQPRHSLEKYFLSLTAPNQHVDTFTD